MPESFPFCIGLDTSQIELPTPSITGSPFSALSSYTGSSYSQNATGYNGTKVGISEPQLEDGRYISDKSLKQIYLPMTVFNSFPVETKDGTLGYVTDGDANSTTKNGILSHRLNGGKCGFPGLLNDSILQAQQGNVTAYKVGASIKFEYGDKYFQHYYPEVQWKIGNGGDFLKLKYNGYLIAEVVVATSSNEGRVLRINMVDDGPNDFKLDLIGAYCLLDEVKDLFTITAVKGRNSTIIGKDEITFPFASKRYDYVNGEISGYSPEKVLSYGKRKADPLFTNYHMTVKAGPKTKTGHPLVRVRFFIDPKNREKAEKLVKKKLPDELFKTNYQGETVQIQPVVPSFSTNELANKEIVDRITAAGAKISSYLIRTGQKYNNSGRGLMKAEIKRLNSSNPTVNEIVKREGFKWVSKNGTDCSGGVSWILAEAGLLDLGDKKNFWPPHTGDWKNYKNSWPKELPLAKGYKGIPVPIAEAQPGDIVLWDRNKSSMNHLIIKAPQPDNKKGDSFIFNFGETGCRKQQPQSGSHLSKVSGGCWAWRIVPDV